MQTLPIKKRNHPDRTGRVNRAALHVPLRLCLCVCSRRGLQRVSCTVVPDRGVNPSSTESYPPLAH
jgi:hypothetical protein